MELDAFAKASLANLREAGLHRQLRTVASAQGPRIVVDGRQLTNFSSNDYLGLADDPLLREAAIRAIERYGVGAGASRLICGNLAPYAELEERLAAFKGREAAVVFASGYAANVGTICALVGKGDTVILDKLNHASIIDGARQSGATIRVYPHGDLNKLEHLLKGNRAGRVLVVTESVFSMDGDLAPLKELVELKERHGAWLMIDEAHATGLFGPQRRGLAEALGVSDRIEVTMGTLSKALGSVGGFVCGSRSVVDLLINRARSLIYSTALPPAVVAAASAAVEFVMSGAGQARRDALWRKVSELKLGLGRLGFSIGSRSAILPLVLGDEVRAADWSRRLLDRGCFAPAIRYPTVARGAARLRLTVTAAHSGGQLADLVTALHELAH